MKVARVNDRPFQTLDSLLGIGASIPPIVFPDSPSTVLQLINKSGGDVDAGDVVVIDPGDDVSFTTTTNAREEISVGIAQDTIVADASGPILVEGYATLVNVPSSQTRGDFLETHTVAKQATGNATRHSGSFGQFLTGGTTPLAWLWGSTDPSASGTITVGDGGTPVTGVDTVIFSGATVTDDTGGQVTITIAASGAHIGCKIYAAAFQSLSNNTETLVDFPSEEWDSSDLHFTSASNLTGTVTKTNGSATIAGSGTSFTTELSVNQVISIPGTAAEIGVVKTITNNTSLDLWQTMTHTASGQTATRKREYVAVPAGYAGKWKATGSGVFSTNGTGRRYIVMATSAGNVRGSQSENAPTSVNFPGAPAIANVDLAEGDYLAMLAFQSSGGALNFGFDGSAPPAQATLTFEYLGT